MQINPHLRFYTNLRGYVLTEITPTQLRADFECVPYVSEPGAEVFTRASFVVEDGVPGLNQVYDRPPSSTLRSRPGDPEQVIDETVAWETVRP